MSESTTTPPPSIAHNALVGVKHASLAKISVQPTDPSGLEIKSQMPMMTAKLYKRVLELATNVSVDVPLPSANSDEVTLLEYPLPTLAALITIEPLEIEYSKIPPPVLRALSVNSYNDSAIFDLINKAYQDALGMQPTEHAFYKRLKELKYRINTSALMCQQKHSSLDEEAHKQLADNHMYEAFDELYAHLNEIEVEDPDKVASAIQHQLDKINAFYKHVYDEQRERLRQVKQQTDETMRALALQEARRREEEQAALVQRTRNAPVPPPSTAPPSLHPGRLKVIGESTGVSSAVQTPLVRPNPLSELRRAPQPVRPLSTVAAKVDPVVVKQAPSVHLSLRDSVARAREQAAQLLASEIEPAPMPVVDYGHPAPAPPADPQPSRHEFLQRMKVLKTDREREAKAQPVVVNQHAVLVVVPVEEKKRSAFLERFKRAEQERYGDVVV